MGLFKDWKSLMENQTDDTIEAFWKEYSDAETKIYTHILANHKEHLKGTVENLAQQFECDKVIFTGFLDGINTSLKKEMDLEKVKADTLIDLDIDFERLFFNMLKADADYLFTIDHWNNVLTEEKRTAIVKEYKRSKTIHVEKKPGRNEPCSCGSGKKYKKCCGK